MTIKNEKEVTILYSEYKKLKDFYTESREEHNDFKKNYAKLKEDLAEKHADSRENYTEAKKKFIQKTLKRAWSRK